MKSMARYIFVSGGKKHASQQPQQLKGRRFVSVVLPTYNEEGNIEQLVKQIAAALKPYDYEIIVVDDDSTDRTPAIMDLLAKSSRFVAVHRYGKRGIFSAIRDGIAFARGEFVAIMDADFSHPPQKLGEMVSAAAEFDMVSGSRFVKGSGIEAPFGRKFPTILLNAAIRLVMMLPYRDVTGGFHVMRAEKFRQLRFRYPAVWGEFDLELFFLAHRNRWKIREVPFVYHYRQEGASKSADTPLKFLLYGSRYFFRAVKLVLFR